MVAETLVMDNQTLAAAVVLLGIQATRQVTAVLVL
jgi:hypothetical protein